MVGFEEKKQSFTFLGAISGVSLWIFLGCGCRESLECLFEIAGRKKDSNFGNKVGESPLVFSEPLWMTLS